MSTMPPAARARFDASLAEAGALVADGRTGDAWPLLETAHILSQPWWRLHVQTHWRRSESGVTRTEWLERYLGVVVGFAVHQASNEPSRGP